MEAKCQGNTGMPAERMGAGAKCQGNAGKCREMPGERMGVGSNCQGNAGERTVVGAVPGECRGVQGNSGECQGNVWECKLLGECRECWGCRGMPGIHMGVGVECQRNAGDNQGNAREWV